MRNKGSVAYFIFLIAAVLLSGCSGNKQDTKTAIELSPPTEQDANLARGEKEYRLYCLTCHQQDGNGVRTQFPPLAGNTFVTGTVDTLVRVVLLGLQGPVTVNGQLYNTQIMPAQNYLSDQQIADVLTYIRNAWGNKAEEISAEEVQKVRKELN